MSSVFQGGVGLRPLHYPDFLNTEEKPSAISWLEIISENYMDSHGRPIEVVRELRKKYPIACHGVSLSIAAPEELDFAYLDRLKRLYSEIDPFLISDHLCWTGQSAHNLHDLLPIVHDAQTLDFVCERVAKVQDYLGRNLVLENVSVYVESTRSTMSEAEFLVALAKRTGAKLLLDINNVYVSETNFSRDPKLFIDSIPREFIAQIHLAGFSDMGDFLFDTHSKPVYPAVWELYRYALPKVYGLPTLLEWDEDIPSLLRINEELLIAQKFTESFEETRIRKNGNIEAPLP